MKKQVIEFKQKEYNEKVNDLNKVINTVNEAISILVSNGIEPTFEIIRDYFTNTKKFIQDRFKDEINKICNIAGLSIDYVEQNKYSSAEWIIIGANNKIRFLYEIESLCYLYKWCFNKKYFIIDNGIAKLTDNCLDILKEECSIYTETSLQNEALQYVIELSNIYNTLNSKLNNKKLISSFLNYVDGEYKIDGDEFKKIFSN